MARPRKDSPEKPAIQRLEDAFWELLSERRFPEITIAALSTKANVNHNTFYYYYENLEDMAQQCFERNIPPRLAKGIVALMRGELTEADFNGLPEDTSLRMQRFCMFSRGDSIELTTMAKELVQNMLFEAAGKDPAELSPDDIASIDFIIGGLFGLMNNEYVKANPHVLMQKVQKEPGASLAKGLVRILS